MKIVGYCYSFDSVSVNYLKSSLFDQCNIPAGQMKPFWSERLQVSRNRKVD